jgi:hypothetical protein
MDAGALPCNNQSRAGIPANNRSRKVGAPIMKKALGTFEVKINPLPHYNADEAMLACIVSYCSTMQP